MAKQVTARIVVLLIAAVMAVPAVAGKRCYSAAADDGNLEFSGVVEGDSFRGHFGEFSVRVCMRDKDLSDARIEVSVATGSADVGNREGNEALRGEELFAVERYPEAVWKSCRIMADGDGYRAEGELTLRGITAAQPVRMRLETGDDGLRLVGGAEIMRLDWNVGTGEDFEDTDFLRDRVDLSFDLDLRGKSIHHGDTEGAEEKNN